MRLQINGIRTKIDLSVCFFQIYSWFIHSASKRVAVKEHLCRKSAEALSNVTSWVLKHFQNCRKACCIGAFFYCTSPVKKCYVQSHFSILPVLFLVHVMCIRLTNICTGFKQIVGWWEYAKMLVIDPPSMYIL